MRFLLPATCALVSTLALLPVVGAADAAGAGEKPMTGKMVLHPENAPYATVPIAPECNALVGMRGDPTKEAATFLVRMTGGCVVAWHWHHATEEVLLIKGSAVAQMKGSQPTTLGAGAYLQLPAEHVHRFRCASKQPCYMFVVADRPFDMNYVDEKGTAVTPADAIAATSKGEHPGW